MVFGDWLPPLTRPNEPLSRFSQRHGLTLNEERGWRPRRDASRCEITRRSGWTRRSTCDSGVKSSTRLTSGCTSPKLGDKELIKLSPSMIRTWHAGLLAAGKPGSPTVAKCYRLLHAILATAVEDEMIPKNPCLLRGASTERPAERPVATIKQVYAIADAIGPPYRMMVLLAAFTGLRLGELRVLRRPAC